MYQLEKNKSYKICFIDGTITILTNDSATKSEPDQEAAAKKFLKVFNKTCSKDAEFVGIKGEQVVLVYRAYPKELSKIIINPEDATISDVDTYKKYLKEIFNLVDKDYVDELITKYIRA